MNTISLHIKSVIGLLVLSACCLSSCTKQQKKANGTFFGGEIVNPNINASAVVLVKNDVAIDTITLDARNRFMYEFKDFNPGLYNFFLLNGEAQMVFIEEGDSIMLRVNTIDFDESLSFTGIGAEKNNFLIDLFLKKEEEDGQMKYLYQKTPQAFEKSLDSFYRVRKKMYESFTQKNEVSTAFDLSLIHI